MMDQETASRVCCLMAEKVEVLEALKAERARARTPKARQEISGKIRFNGYLLGVLVKLASGRMVTPERHTVYETR